MDPGWLLLFILLVTEAVSLSILILPMPNNTIRGFVIDFFSKTWAGSNILRYLTFFLLLLNVVYFASSMSSIYSVEAFGAQRALPTPPAPFPCLDLGLEQRASRPCPRNAVGGGSRTSRALPLRLR